jgi:signal transduction histidine kinase
MGDGSGFALRWVSARVPGTGAGLAGLAERVELDGGALEFDCLGGVFTLRARLPWWRGDGHDPRAAGRR